VLHNGDRITGRILYAQFGYLQLNSEHSGTVAIEWPSIHSIESHYEFRVERAGGRLYTGSIRTSACGCLSDRRRRAYSHVDTDARDIPTGTLRAWLLESDRRLCIGRL
jgi:hypothetical protein